MLKKVEEELVNCKKVIVNKVSTLSTEKVIDYIHDACHTLIPPQGGREVIPSMSALNK